jgi:hypothetical protein
VAAPSRSTVPWSPAARPRHPCHLRPTADVNTDTAHHNRAHHSAVNHATRSGSRTFRVLAVGRIGRYEPAVGCGRVGQLPRSARYLRYCIHKLPGHRLGRVVRSHAASGQPNAHTERTKVRRVSAVTESDCYTIARGCGRRSRLFGSLADAFRTNKKVAIPAPHGVSDEWSRAKGRRVG